MANDGIAPEGKALLEKAGFEVDTNKIEQADLPARINDYDVLVVRSATKVNADILNAANRLKLVVRAGVGIDNIDSKTAKERGIDVRNTPNSSTLSVAELAIAHMFAIARFLPQSNRFLREKGNAGFKDLKKEYEKGFELRGKTLGVVGFGRIGRETAKIAIGLGMKVKAFNRTQGNFELVFDHLPFDPAPKMTITSVSLEEVCRDSDFISLHVPHSSGQPALIDDARLASMKKGVVIINAARGGVVDEAALMNALSTGQVSAAALDVFEQEPNFNEILLSNDKLSLTPHIGASTKEAQERVSQEVAQVIIDKFRNN